jgi:peptide-methionine (S)-S-oxide reductase
MKRILLSVLGTLALITANLTPAVAADPAVAAGKASAILAGGCFWCVEHDFRQLPGVVDAVSGYAGGSRAKPTYQDYHDTDAANPVPHIEVVQVTWDPSKLNYAQILDYYFRHIDPTDNGGQFCDRGPAYRPAIFAGTADEKTMAEAKSAEVAKLIKKPVAVDILPAAQFWPAEDYHQDYAEKNPLKYKYYRWNCGRDQRVQAVWSVATN